MRDLAIHASRLFLELVLSGEAVSPCWCFLGSTLAGEGEIAGADERLWGLGFPPLPPPLPPSLPPLSPFWGVLEGVWAFWRSASCRLCLSLSRVFYVTFVLVVTMFATVTTGDDTPEIVPMGHCFPIFRVLLLFQLQHSTTAEVAVKGMTMPPLVSARLAVEEWGCTCFRFNLIHGTQVTPIFTTTLFGVSGIFMNFPFATLWG